MAGSSFERLRMEEIDLWIEVVEWRDKELWEWARNVGMVDSLATGDGETDFFCKFSELQKCSR